MKIKKNLLKKRKKLFNELNKIGPFVDGSLSMVKRICGNKNCRCRTDPAKKHPALFLTWKEQKKTKAIYVPIAMINNAKLWNKNYKKLKNLIRKISNIQKDWLKLRDT